MKHNRSAPFCRGLLMLFVCACTLYGKPYRFLLVVSDQWQDPASQIIEGESDFAIVAALLKSWGLPFDIVRLDQQRFDPYYLMDREGQPRYGTIVFTVNPQSTGGQNFSLLSTLVREHGVGMVVLGDGIGSAEIGKLAGIVYESEYAVIEDLKFGSEHFITRALKGREPEFLAGGGRKRGDKVHLRGATLLASRGPLPFLAVREFPGGGRVVWLDAHRQTSQIGIPIVRDLFKRSLVWAQDYALYAEYGKTALIEMHDMGASDKSFLPYWHYRSLSEQEIRSGVIGPLKRHGAVLTQVVVTGFVDRKTRRILNPWQQTKVIDELDRTTIHDYASTKRGLDAGRREGVFEIQSHGWTHMLPDLDSLPGPFWDAPLDGTATLGWDNEFGDRIRKAEIPASVQRNHMERSIECLGEDFGVVPLFIRPGGGEYSRTWANHTARIAASLGFGLARLAVPFYLGPDRVIALGPAAPYANWSYEKGLPAGGILWSADGPAFVAFHDRDVAMDADSVERLLGQLGPGVRYMTAGEYCAYLHTAVTAESTGGGVVLAIRYDDQYCRYFASHSSTWTLHLSDEIRTRLPVGMPEKRAIVIPPGTGTHMVDIGHGDTSLRGTANQW
jgi:peptidoglycan/xylan/chitin deacetylase (PgdA/CDA1 family)